MGKNKFRLSHRKVSRPINSDITQLQGPHNASTQTDGANIQVGDTATQTDTAPQTDMATQTDAATQTDTVSPIDKADGAGAIIHNQMEEVAVTSAATQTGKFTQACLRQIIMKAIFRSIRYHP